MSDHSTLRLSVADGLARLTLTRPAALNALSASLIDELISALSELEARAEARVLLVQGEGRAFSVGMDLRSMATMLGSGGAPSKEDLRASAEQGAKLIAAIDQSPLVTVASVHGYAIGAGFLITSACDLRVAAEETVFALPEVDIGLPLAWGGVPLVSRELGLSRARELILSGRRFGTAELSGTGFLHRCVPEAERESVTEALVADLLDKPAAALRLTYELLRQQKTPGAGGRSEREVFVEAFSSPDFVTAAMRYIQRLQGA